MFRQKNEQNDEMFEAAKLFVSPSPVDSGPEWSEAAEGQLSVDVLETDTHLVVVATMAGTRPEDIYLHLHNDFLTIRGSRKSPVDMVNKFFYEECYWGKFSRTIVLPVDVKGELAESEYRFGVLTIKLPKAEVKKEIPILVIEE